MFKLKWEIIIVMAILMPCLVSAGTCPVGIGVCDEKIPFQSAVITTGTINVNYTTALNGSFVPYTGATGDVDLGIHKFIGDGSWLTGISTYNATYDKWAYNMTIGLNPFNQILNTTFYVNFSRLSINGNQTKDGSYVLQVSGGVGNFTSNGQAINITSGNGFGNITGHGTNAGKIFIIGGHGGNATSIDGGLSLFAQAGNGSDIIITSGLGGHAITSGATSQGGRGGDVNITASNGGDALGVADHKAGDGGNIFLTIGRHGAQVNPPDEFDGDLKVFDSYGNTLLDITGDNTKYFWLPTNSEKLLFGASQSASINYNGTDFIVNPREVGGGNLYLNNWVLPSPSSSSILTTGNINFSNGGATSSFSVGSSSGQSFLNLVGPWGGPPGTYRGGSIRWFKGEVTSIIGGYNYILTGNKFVWSNTSQSGPADNGTAWVDFDDGSASFSKGNFTISPSGDMNTSRNVTAMFLCTGSTCNNVSDFMGHADYQFTNNDFNGSGNITTSGATTLTTLKTTGNITLNGAGGISPAVSLIGGSINGSIWMRSGVMSFDFNGASVWQVNPTYVYFSPAIEINSGIRGYSDTIPVKIHGGTYLFSNSSSAISNSRATQVTPKISTTSANVWNSSALWIAPYYTGTQNGTHYLIDAGNTSAAGGAGSYDRKFSVDMFGNVNTTGNVTADVYHGTVDWVYTIIGMSGDTSCNNLDNKISGLSYTCQTCIDTAGSTVTCSTTLVTLNAQCGCHVD